MLLELRTNQADPLHILKSTQTVLRGARRVRINTHALQNLALALEEMMPAVKTQYIGGNNETDSALAAQKSLILNALNFCFWAEHNAPVWTVEWPEGKIYKGGTYALIAALERAEANGYPIYDAEFLSRLYFRDAREIFRSETAAPIPLFKERVKNLREAGQTLCDRAQGSFLNIIRSSEYDAISLTRALVNNFPSFNDTTRLDGKSVFFHKRAQICAHSIALLSNCFPEFALRGAELLTAFADYRLPQVFRHFGVLEYSPFLAQIVDSHTLLQAGGRMEIEIRAATVWVAELLRQHFGGTYSARNIDFASWLLSQKIKSEMLPHHRTYTIFY